MNRFENIPSSNELLGKRVIVTGCGYSQVKYKFHDIVDNKETHDPIFIDGVEYKLNMASATAIVLAKKGAIVHMVSMTEEKLKHIKDYS
jgi:hypothetical protein